MIRNRFFFNKKIPDLNLILSGRKYILFPPFSMQLGITKHETSFVYELGER